VAHHFIVTFYLTRNSTRPAGGHILWNYWKSFFLIQKME